jgi:hypothetical protein
LNFSSEQLFRLLVVISNHPSPRRKETFKKDIPKTVIADIPQYTTKKSICEASLSVFFMPNAQHIMQNITHFAKLHFYAISDKINTAFLCTLAIFSGFLRFVHLIFVFWVAN